MKIKDLPRVDRPREKLLKYGPAKLTTAELRAILLRTGIKGFNVIELSNKILKFMFPIRISIVLLSRGSNFFVIHAEVMADFVKHGVSHLAL